ncbi:hypothetical protein [Thermogymnomonas acidicola]|uniref:mevalonate-3-kinase n=1 Tax=Thermogymnomonas acidicola TaxID=399579 RepID=UPI0009464E22|nr:mevalonate-3-kinase [Thermogymnomonas acidicola]
MDPKGQANWAVAYPTIGIILLGGISDPMRRRPLHLSAGIAYTSDDGRTMVRTRLFYASPRRGTVNGAEIDASSPRSPFRLIDRYAKYIDGAERVSFESENVNVISGSSDGAAAAFGLCLSSASGGSLSLAEMEDDLRMISESVGRSLFGGLTITDPDKGLRTERLLDARDFSQYRIIACRFSEKRNPSDAIHSSVVRNSGYQKRVESTREKGRTLRELAASRDIEGGIFELAMGDTDEYHRLVEASGVHVITDGMRALMSRVRELRREVWCTYIVTGGTNVFVPARKGGDVPELVSALEPMCSGVEVLRVAGPPHFSGPS